MHALFRFYGPLNDFLTPGRRHTAFAYPFVVPGSVKDMIEAAGGPHPEVELILANGTAVDFSYLVRDGDRIAVYPAFHSLDLSVLGRLRPELSEYRFVLDTHLGALAGYLRMLGFDALYSNDANDEELASICHTQARILLTRDRGLLKRREVVHGCFLRQTDPARQLDEVLARYSLLPKATPFRRCLRCNGLLHEVDKDSVRERLPGRTALYFDAFTICGSCGRIYWEGSHVQNMKRFLAHNLHLAQH